MPKLWGLLVLSIGMTLVPGIDTWTTRSRCPSSCPCPRQFLDGADAALPTALAVALVPVACSLAGLSLWTIASGGLRELLRSERAQRIQERVMGTALVALSVRVALDR
jgi:threonine/homoserine/homoserine lactone efflux protein